MLWERRHASASFPLPLNEHVIKDGAVVTDKVALWILCRRILYFFFNIGFDWASYVLWPRGTLLEGTEHPKGVLRRLSLKRRLRVVDTKAHSLRCSSSRRFTCPWILRMPLSPGEPTEAFNLSSCDQTHHRSIPSHTQRMCLQVFCMSWRYCRVPRGSSGKDCGRNPECKLRNDFAYFQQFFLIFCKNLRQPYFIR